MATRITSKYYSNFTLSTFLYLLLLTTTTITPPTITVAVAANITSLLSSYPDLSEFTDLLSTAGVSLTSELANRDSITLLVVPNSYLSTSSDFTRRLSPSALADILRYHILLQFLSLSDLRQIPPTGSLITTLYQTTGRASSNFGSVNITRAANSITIHSPATYSPSNATVLGLVKTLPYNISIISVSGLLVPYESDLTASELRPPPLGLNITKALLDGHNFNVVASMLLASGIVDEFQQDEGGAGITFFAPTDSAFANLPDSVNLQSLPADKKAVVLRFHVLHSYYPLGSLESIVNPVQPTLATETNGAGSFTLNISRVNGSVAISTGIVLASVTQTVFDQKPVAIFGVSHILLPMEIFGKNAGPMPGNPELGTAPSPDISMAPENSQGSDGPPSHLTSPPGFREGIISASCGGDNNRYGLNNLAVVVTLFLLYSICMCL
ncbi:hypothetical protein ACFE04_010306 [Oxalis oulophora]